MDSIANDLFEMLLRNSIREIVKARGETFGVSAVQRHCKIGYNSAVKLLEEAEKRWVIKKSDDPKTPYLYQANFNI